MLHLDNWVESPGQGRPLLLGDGLLQSLTRVRSPPPQDAEHSPQDSHEPHLPSTSHIHRQSTERCVISYGKNESKKVFYI